MLMVDTFMHEIPRIILKIYCPQRVTNEQVRRKAEVEKEISSVIKRKRWIRLRHVLRMDNTMYATIALWTPDGKRKNGLPKES